jgi:hypothetical protein
MGSLRIKIVAGQGMIPPCKSMDTHPAPLGGALFIWSAVLLYRSNFPIG